MCGCDEGRKVQWRVTFSASISDDDRSSDLSHGHPHSSPSFWVIALWVVRRVVIASCLLGSCGASMWDSLRAWGAGLATIMWVFGVWLKKKRSVPCFRLVQLLLVRLCVLCVREVVLRPWLLLGDRVGWCVRRVRWSCCRHASLVSVVGHRWLPLCVPTWYRLEMVESPVLLGCWLKFFVDVWFPEWAWGN